MTLIFFVFGLLLTVVSVNSFVGPDLKSVTENLHVIGDFHTIAKRETRRSDKSKLTNQKAINFVMKMNIFYDQKKKTQVSTKNNLELWNELDSTEQAELRALVPAFVCALEMPKPSLSGLKAGYAEISGLSTEQLKSVSESGQILLISAQEDLALFKKVLHEWRKLDGRAKADLELVSEEGYRHYSVLAEIAEAVFG